MSRAYFNETQKFRQPWIIAIVLLAIGLWAVPIIISLATEEDMARDAMIGIIVSFLVMAGMIFLFFRMALVIRIRKEGIHYRFFPFHFREKLIRKEEIEKFEVRKYKPIAEYGGWGIRPGIRGHGRAFNVSGNMGLQLYLNNGKKLLIGTQKPLDIGKAMEAMMANDS